MRLEKVYSRESKRVVPRPEAMHNLGTCQTYKFSDFSSDLLNQNSEDGPKGLL